MKATKIKALQTVNISPQGRPLRMLAGQEYEIMADANEIDSLVRGKYAEVVKPKRAPRKAKATAK